MSSTADDVVISGMSGRFPNSDNVQEFHDHLLNKRDLITDDDRRWKLDHPEVPKRCGILDNIEKFDAGFFGMHPPRVDVTDSMVRMFMETAVEAIMDAGMSPGELEGSRTGVFVSKWPNLTDAIDNLMGNSIMAQRVSYFLKLKGPSFGVDSACSSSLNALEAAVKAINGGQCDYALVGGGNLARHPNMIIQFFRLSMLSKDGMNRVFDQDADGYVKSEAVACIFLQKAATSKRIYAKIVNIKSNHDGFKDRGILFPSSQSQQQLMMEVCKESGVTPDDLSFIEAHGTGTPVGDLEELDAIDGALAVTRRKPLPIGSVKSYIGHTEMISGVCSIVKVLLAFETGFIAPNINYNRPQKGMRGIEEERIGVLTEIMELKEDEAVIGVNNFGFGGSNVHVLLKRHAKKKIDAGAPKDALPRLVCVSGRTERQVLTLLEESGSYDAEYIGLLHEVFKRGLPGGHYRGYSVVSKHGVTSLEIKVTKERPRPLVVFFGRLNNYKDLGRYLAGFRAVRRITDVLANKRLTFAEVLEGDDMLGPICVQLLVAEILKRLAIPTKVCGNNLLSDYLNDVTTLEKTIDLLLSKTPSFSSFDSFSRSLVLNISDSPLGSDDLMVVQDNKVKFLETLGRLYQEGYDFPVSRLYPPVQFPVSRTTKMISPLISWNHDKDWQTFKFKKFISDEQQMDYQLTLDTAEYKYIAGHVIDGRNLIPAAEYLCLVWKTLAAARKLLTYEIAVTFSNCKFVRAVVMPKKGAITLSVVVQKQSGKFEVTESGSVVVTGQVQIGVESTKWDMDPTSNRPVLTQEEVYKELTLRGYNYSGVFKGIHQCTVDGSLGLAAWSDNYTAFVDLMLQMDVLRIDTRLLFVPVGVTRLTIDPMTHARAVVCLDDNKKVLPIYVCKHSHTVRSGGIEIRGIHARSILRKKPLFEPILERHQFVPNSASLTLPEAVRVNTQIVLENSLAHQFKAVEVGEIKSVSLLPFIAQVLKNTPMVTADLTSSPDGNLAAGNNYLLVVGSNILDLPIMSFLHKNGFVLSREAVDFVTTEVAGIEVITEYTTPEEKLVLFRPTQAVALDSKFHRVSKSNFAWLPQLKTSLVNGENVIVTTSTREPEGVLGLVNCLRMEPNGNKVKCFVTMDEAPELDLQADFYQPQVRKNMAFNVYKDQKWGTYRHLLVDPTPRIECDNSYAKVATRGDLSTLQWFERRPSPPTLPPDGHTLISTNYTAVNFRDIMIATGRVGAEVVSGCRIEQEKLIGMEFSGRTASGQRVTGITCGAFSTCIVADNSLIWKVPDAWSLEDAATVPVVYTTVLYALLMRGQMRRGSSILIHSATGGVGIAALNVCLYHDCDIYVTVGTQEKRDFLKNNYPQILDSHVGNSRDISFEEMIKTQTGGRGVDFVLNSLSDDKLQASVRCLTRGGCFLEIGKFDLAMDTHLGLLLMEKEAVYHGVMLDRIFLESEEKKQHLQHLLSDGIKAGYVEPLPRVVFNAEEIQASFRHMMTGKHIGKVLIKLRDESVSAPAKFLVKKSFNCDPNCSYVIVGGLGGFGLELADWLVLRGARKLFLVSRSGVQTGYQKRRLRIWKSYGVNVTVSTNDTTTKEGCEETLNEAKKLGPVDAIFNLAVVLKDALFINQTEKSFLESLLPKAHVTIHLDQTSRQLCPQLRYFVCFSSVSCGRGNAGQSNYGMANSIMERICERRRLEGLPALVIQWGAIGDVGLVAKQQPEDEAIGGTIQQKMPSCLEALDHFLVQPHPVVASMVVAEKQSIQNKTTAVEAVAQILGINNLKTVSPHSTLGELGMDSMMAVEVIQTLERNFDIFVSPKDIQTFTFTKITELTEGKDRGVVAHRPLGSIFKYVPTFRRSDTPFSDLTDNNETETVYLLPGFEGAFTPLEGLSKGLKARLVGVDYNCQTSHTVQNISASILPHIEATITDATSLILIGHSFGANVALELTSLLEEKGHSVKLILLDGAPAYLRTAIRTFFPYESEKEFQTEILLQILSLWLSPEQLQQSKNRLSKCSTFVEKLEVMMSSMPQKVLSDLNFEQAVAVAVYERFNSIVSYEFPHEKIRSDVYLIKAEHSLVGSDNNDYGLSELVEKPVVVGTVGGDHFSMLSMPELTHKLNHILQKYNE